jgi:molybdenum cofactor cytidylyltransferase
MIGIIILAAGSSSRMGQPKQQLVYKDTTLLQRAIEAAKGVQAHALMVVLGANNQTILDDVDSKHLDIVINPDWEQGMSSSIKSGITALLTLYPKVDDVLMMLCDQPFVDTELLKELIEAKPPTDDAIVACEYKNTIGVPVLFGKDWFADLQDLKGEDGAKKLLLSHQDKVIAVPFDQGSIDIDTPDDYRQLLNN